jgi:HAD superfamily hydrolase (TIGR01459 family)
MRPVPDAIAAAEGYDGLLLDQFGTLHDGQRPYAGAPETLAALRAAGKRVVLLSNSGKRAAGNRQRLARLGFPDALYDILLTSGEVGWRLLAEGALAEARDARRCLLLSRDGDRSPVEGLGIEVVPEAAKADLVIIAASEGERVPIEDYAALLAPAAQAGVPALCLNPDRTMLVAGGQAFGAGRIAELYEALGGQVTWIGKPHPAIYAAALRALGDPPPARILGLGDSLEHDIAGARRAGCGAGLVLTGVAAGLRGAALEAACAEHGARPDLVMEGFAAEAADARG